MAFYHLPNPWNPGYSIPEYVLAEPPGRGTFTTKWLPRRTISQLAPDFLAKPTSTLSKPKHGKQGSLSGSSLGNNTIYDLEPLGQVSGGGAQLFENYGEQVSSWITKNIKNVPPQQRGEAIKKFLDAVDPGLYRRTEATKAKYKAQGMSASGALQKALAAEFEKGLGKEVVELGKKGKPKAVGQLACCGFRSGLGAFNPLTAITDFVSSGLDAVGGLACKILGNPLAPVAAAGAAAAAGAPPQVGVAGATIAGGMCGGSQTAATTPPTGAKEGMPGWVIPVAIGGGALLLVLVLK